MAVIDRDQLYNDELLWLPEGNVLTEAQMRSINEFVIANQIPEDDDQHYAEALCKGLKAIGQANLSKAAVDRNGLKREEVGDEEVEYFDSSSRTIWQYFLDSLKDICPIFGYTGISASTGMKINPGNKIYVGKKECPPVSTNEPSICRHGCSDDMFF